MMSISGINNYIFIDLSSYNRTGAFCKGELSVDFDEHKIGDIVIFKKNITPVKEKLPNNKDVLRFSRQSVYLIIKQ